MHIGVPNSSPGGGGGRPRWPRRRAGRRAQGQGGRRAQDRVGRRARAQVDRRVRARRRGRRAPPAAVSSAPEARQCAGRRPCGRRARARRPPRAARGPSRPEATAAAAARRAAALGQPATLARAPLRAAQARPVARGHRRRGRRRRGRRQRRVRCGCVRRAGGRGVRRRRRRRAGRRRRPPPPPPLPRRRRCQGHQGVGEALNGEAIGYVPSRSTRRSTVQGGARRVGLRPAQDVADAGHAGVEGRRHREQRRRAPRAARRHRPRRRAVAAAAAPAVAPASNAGRQGYRRYRLLVVGGCVRQRCRAVAVCQGHQGVGEALQRHRDDRLRRVVRRGAPAVQGGARPAWVRSRQDEPRDGHAQGRRVRHIDIQGGESARGGAHGGGGRRWRRGGAAAAGPR